MLPNRYGLGTMVDLEKVSSMEIYMPESGTGGGYRDVYMRIQGFDDELYCQMKRKKAYGLANVLMGKEHYTECDYSFIDEYEKYIEKHRNDCFEITDNGLIKRWKEE